MDSAESKFSIVGINITAKLEQLLKTLKYNEYD